MQEEHYMRMALELAQKGCGWVNPNPMVGAVIVKEGRVIGQGYHEEYGGLHAERNALKNCMESPEGATLYVTLEPCCHWGKTPPCTDAILENGICRVVVGTTDTNPKVGGHGIEILKKNGVDVSVGVLEEECRRQNEVFFHYMKDHRPYVVMKYAMTMDGKIATHTGKSRWITGEEARQQVQQDRHRYMGIMVGIGTVLKDDPLLTCRLEKGRNPVRIICDSGLRMPADSQIVRTASEIPTMIATCCEDRDRYIPYKNAGCEILCVLPEDGHLNLRELMRLLGERKMDSILLEGGGSLNWSALQAGIVSRVQTYIAPKIFGGESSISPVRGVGIDEPEGAFRLSRPRIIRLGEDILLESEVITCSQES